MAGTAQDAAARVSLRYAGKLEISRGAEGVVRPEAVTCTPFGGELVVTDARQMGLHILNGAGREIFRTNRFADLLGPRDACLDADGRLVYLKRIAGRNHSLRRLDLYGEPEGFRVATPRADFDPRHLLVTRDGHYLLLDTDTGTLVKNDATTGALIWVSELAGYGIETADGEDEGLLQLGRPAEGPDGRIAVPGGQMHRVLIVAADGTFITSFGRFGTSPGRMVLPVAAVYAPDGTLCVLDRMRHKILFFGPDYRVVGEFGAQGNALGEFYHPVAMAGSADGRLFVAQGFEGRVQVFNILTTEDH